MPPFPLEWLSAQRVQESFGRAQRSKKRGKIPGISGYCTHDVALDSGGGQNTQGEKVEQNTGRGGYDPGGGRRTEDSSGMFRI